MKIILILLLLATQTKAQIDTVKSFIPRGINSVTVDYAPSLSADGRTMIFQSNRDGKYKLYISHLKENDFWSKPESIDEINDFQKGSELIGGPCLSYDGNQIYFFAFFNKTSREDIYYSNRMGTGWSAPINAGNKINTSNYEGFPSISSDGKRLYFVRNKPNKDNPDAFCTKIMMSEKDDQGNWKMPKELPAPINSNCEKCPKILSDNETMIFASTRNNKKSPLYDLFISHLQADQSWSKPISLDIINSVNDDQFATIASKGDRIYYINNKSGNYDIYFTNLPDELRPRAVTDIRGFVKNKNNDPVEASLLIYRDGILTNGGGLFSNSSDGNYSMTLINGSAYQVIVKAPGYKVDTLEVDLRITKDYEVRSQDIILKSKDDRLEIITINSVTNKIVNSVLLNLASKEEIKQDSIGKFSLSVKYGSSYQLKVTHGGFESKAFSFVYNSSKPNLKQIIKLKPLQPKIRVKVLDAETKTSIIPHVEFKEEGKQISIFNGQLASTGLDQHLEFNKIYRLRIRLKGYFSYEDTVSLRDVFEGKLIEKLVLLVPIRAGNKLTLNSIHFDYNSSEIKPESMPVLNEVAVALCENRNVTIEISAHTDNIGGNDFNLALSQKRAEAVKKYLVNRSASPDVILSKGYGSSDPLMPNDTEANRSLNRRVEFKILK